MTLEKSILIDISEHFRVIFTQSMASECCAEDDMKGGNYRDTYESIFCGEQATFLHP